MVVATQAGYLPQGQDLPLLPNPSPAALVSLMGRLDTLLLALASLVSLTEAQLQEAVQTLQLSTVFPTASADSLANPLVHPRQWRSPQAQSFSLSEARSLVLVITYLAQQHQELLRRAVSLMEQQTELGQDPTQTTLLGGYLANFRDCYTAYDPQHPLMTPEDWQRFAFKQVIDLLFYSLKNGHRRLWLVLLERLQGQGEQTR